MTCNGNNRPWGFYEILSNKDDHKVKRITVYAGKRLSLQKHKKRNEHWYILSGKGAVTIGEKSYYAVKDVSFDIYKGIQHRIENKGTEDLVFIEVQTGEYFGEDDIERIEDDFGRE